MTVRNGRININRFWSNQHGPDGKSEDGVRIELIDESSHVHFVEINMSLAEFAEAIFGRSEIKVLYETRGLEYLGKTREHKTVSVPWVNGVKPHMFPRPTDAMMDDMLAPFEVDGWVGRRDDIINSHNYVGPKGPHIDKVHGVRVGFHRFV